MDEEKGRATRLKDRLFKKEERRKEKDRRVIKERKQREGKGKTRNIAKKTNCFRRKREIEDCSVVWERRCERTKKISGDRTYDESDKAKRR